MSIRFKNVFQILTAVAEVAGLLSLLIKKFSIDMNLDSEHVLRRRAKNTSALESSPKSSQTSTS